MSEYDRDSAYYLDPSDPQAKTCKGMMDNFYQASYTPNAAMWMQGAIDKRFKAGDQGLWNMVYGDSDYFQSRRLFFNYIRRQTNMVGGRQRQNRKSTITVPTLQGDDVADEYNTVLKWCEDRDGFQEYFSQSFENSVDVGINLLHMYVDYTFDSVSGDLFTDSVSYNNFLIDPYWRKMDFSDCNGIWRRRWVTHNEAKSLLPKYASEIDKIKPSGVKDGRFPLQAELLNVDRNKLLVYDEFHYRTTRTATFLRDPVTQESMEFELAKDDPENMLDIILASQPWLRVEKREVPTVNLIICIAGHPVYDGPNLLGIDRYPFVPHVCYHEPDIQSYAWRIQGIVRNLRDAQWLYNMRKCIEMDILQSQVNSGWIFPVDVVTDTKALRQKGQGYLIPLKAGHKPDEIQRIEPSAIPQSLLELSKSLAEDIMAISGINEELLGAATDDKSGILSMLRQGAGLTTLQVIFDKSDYTQRLYGTIRLMAIRKLFTRAKVASIIGKEPSDKFFSSNFQKYQVAVEEGNYSATQRQAELQQYLYLREIGVPVANKTLVRLSISSNKKQAMQEMEEEQQQQQQMQMQEAQLKAQKDQADTQLLLAKTEKEQAQARELDAQVLERISQAQENEAWAEEKRMEADFKLTELMLNLENLDTRNLKDQVELSLQLREINEMNALSAKDQL